MTNALSFRNVSCSFDGQMVVNDVSFDIAEGEIVCLLGPSGCGKTTSLRLAAGMEAPSGGEIFLGETCVSTASHVTPPEMRGIGFLFQDFALFPHLSVLDNVTFGLRDMPDNEKKTRALELLKGGRPVRALPMRFPARCRAASSNARLWRVPWPRVRLWC